MARRKKTSHTEELIELVAMLPRWAGVALAPLSYLLLHQVAAQPLTAHPCGTIDSSRHRPRSVWRLPGRSRPGKGSPSLLQEIRRELASADQVDILVSFITVSGVRKLQDLLQQITATGAQGHSATQLRRKGGQAPAAGGLL